MAQIVPTPDVVNYLLGFGKDIGFRFNLSNLNLTRHLLVTIAVFSYKLRWVLSISAFGDCALCL